jgi:hypothetical protein
VFESNMNSHLGELNDKTCCVLGMVIDDSIPDIVRRPYSYRSKWFNWSPAQADWGVLVFHKYISWRTMEEETIESQMGLEGINGMRGGSYSSLLLAKR